MSREGCACGHCEPNGLTHEHNHDHAHGHTHTHGEGGVDRNALIALIGSAALLAAGLLLPMPDSVRIFILLGAWLAAGWEVLLQAVRNILRGRVFDEAFLMTLAGVGAICIGEYPEAAAVMLFYGVGELFQDLAVRRSRASIRDLLDVRPDRASRLTDGVFVPCAAEELLPGDIVQVKPGERIPVDGMVTSGASQTDTSALTGESIPREVIAGDEVLAGYMNLSGVLEVRAVKPFGESTAAKVLELAERAGERKAKTERFITRFARIYTPVVVLAAVGLAVIPSLVTGQWSLYLHRALVFLVVSCPCALVVSVPMAFFAGIGCASRNGILVKSGSVLETLAEVGTVAFDKTGTLTSGIFRVQQIFPGALQEAELLELAAHAELFSNHPIAASLRAAYGGELDPSRVSSAEEQTGGGVTATVDGTRVLLGNLRQMGGIALPELSCKGNIIYTSVDGIFAGAIEIADEPKPEAKETLAGLKALGVRRTLLLTGDRQAVGEGLGREVGIDEVHGGLLPDGKVVILENILNSNDRQGKLLFIGDGMNDAPVLARADVGMAMGGVGSDAAIEAADVVIMDDKLTRLPYAIRIARRTRAIAAQNIALALGIKGAVLLLSAVGLANLWLAVFADVGVSLLAVLNAMRALKAK